jgi:protein subunit release factor B
VPERALPASQSRFGHEGAEVASVRRAPERATGEALGSQIRSYVLHPYQLIKDHRTKEQVGDVNRVLDGDLDGFIKTFLMKKSSGALGDAVADDDAV